MRRLLSIATTCLVLGLLPLQAQIRRTAPSVTSPGRSGFTQHSGFGHGRVFHGSVAFGHHPRFHVFFRPGFHRHRHRPFVFHRFVTSPFFVPVPLFYGGSPYPSQVVDVSGERELAQEVERLRGEVERLREEQASLERGDSDSSPLVIERQGDKYVRHGGSPKAQPTAEPETPATVLVLRDGRRLEVRNYAIAGKTLWAFSERRARKISLAELDLAATAKANEQRGVEFPFQAEAKAK